MLASGFPLLPRFDDFSDRLLEALGDVPLRIMSAHFTQVAVIANVVANAVLFQIRVFLGLAAKRLYNLKRFQNGARVLLATAKIIDLPAARRGIKLVQEQ